MQKRVLILGAGAMQIPALNAAREMNWYTAAADGNPHAAGACCADEFRLVDLKDTGGLLAYARELQQNGGLDAVFTAATDFSAAVSYITGQLGLPGHSYEAACNATVKTRMRACFAAHNVPSPRFVEVTAATPLSAVTAAISFPLVVKPVDNMGARGCRTVSALPELAPALDEALRYSRTNTAIAEEFMDGPEFSVDALVYNGTVHITGFADRHIYYPPYFIEMGHTLPSEFPPQKIQELISVFTDGIRALGLTHGAAKGDLKYTSNGPMIGEIAARLSGGYMSGWTYPYSSGVNLTKAALQLAAGILPDELLKTSRHDIAAERAWVSIPGKVRSIDGLDEAAAVTGVHEVIPRAVAGDRVSFPVNNVEKCGNVLASAPLREDAVAAAEDACRRIFIRLEPNDRATDCFLSGSGSYPPPAYAVPADVVAALPDGDLCCTAGVPPLPPSLQPYAGNVDWNRRSLESALAFLSGYIQKHDISLQRLTRRMFFAALVAGGVQAPVYTADSLNSSTARGNNE